MPKRCRSGKSSVCKMRQPSPVSWDITTFLHCPAPDFSRAAVASGFFSRPGVDQSSISSRSAQVKHRDARCVIPASIDLGHRVTATTRFLDELALADVAAHTLLEVYVGSTDRASRARMLAHLAQRALFDSFNSQWAEQWDHTKCSSQRTDIATIEAF